MYKANDVALGRTESAICGVPKEHSPCLPLWDAQKQAQHRDLSLFSSMLGSVWETEI